MRRSHRVFGAKTVVKTMDWQFKCHLITLLLVSGKSIRFAKNWPCQTFRLLSTPTEEKSVLVHITFVIVFRVGGYVFLLNIR